jgi:hypothetical protein
LEFDLDVLMFVSVMSMVVLMAVAGVGAAATALRRFMPVIGLVSAEE